MIRPDERPAQSSLPLHSPKKMPDGPAMDREVPLRPIGPIADLPITPGHVPSVSPSHIDAPARRAALDELHRRIARGDTNAALTKLDQLVADEPDDIEFLCERATLLTALSRFDRADIDIRRAVKLDEHHPGALLAMGVLSCKRARWRDAIVPLREAIAVTPHAALPYYYLGEAHNHVDDLAPALDAYERAAELDPSNWRALKGVGVVLDRLGRSDEATEAYRRSRDVRTS